MMYGTCTLIIHSQRLGNYCFRGYLKRIALLIALFWIFMWPAAAFGQNVQYTQNTVNSALRSNASVDPSTLGMSLQIPLRAYIGRGEASLPISLYYSSKVWRIKYTNSIDMYGGFWETTTEARYAERSAAGWTSSLSVPTIEWPDANDVWNFNGKPICIPCNTTQTPYRIRRMYLHMPDGSSHEFRKSDVAYNGTVDMTGVFYAVDGSRMRYDTNTATLYLHDGTRYILGGSLTQFIDRNGNTQNFSYNSSTGKWEWVDTVGRRIGQPPLGSSGRADIEYSLPASNGTTAIYTFRWRYLRDPNTGESVITTTNPDQQLRNVSDYYLANPASPPTNPANGNYPQGPAASRLFNSTDSGDGTMEFVLSPNQLFNPVVLAEIVLPNGSSYKFSYNIYGEIDKIIYPTGGYERYVYSQITPLGYQSGPYPQANRGVTERRLSATGNTANEALWQYRVLISAGNVYWVETTNPDSTRSERYLHNFIPAPNGNTNSVYVQFGYDDARNGMAYDERFFAPAAQGGAMLRRKLTQWAMDSTTYASPFPITGSRNYTAHRNHRTTKEVELILDTGSNALVKTTTYAYDPHQNPILTSEYGYTTVDQFTAQNGAINSIPAGPLVRSLEMNFLDNSNQAYNDRSILGLPTSKILRNNSGTMVAYTQIRYDEYGLTSYGSVTNWNDPGTSIRGNATTTSLWLNTSGTYLESHMNYDQCGNVLVTTDALGRQMTVSYADSFSDNVPRNTYAYATTATTPVPDPSGVYGSNTAFVTSSKYDFSTGLVTSATESNGYTTSYQYDSLNRELVVTRPNGGSTTYTYGDTAGNLYTRARTSLNASQMTDAYQYFDGLGRPSRSFVYDGLTATPWSARDTFYDSMGRVLQSSNPYRVSAPGALVSTCGYCTTLEYDALGRVKKETKPDGSYLTIIHGASTTGILGLTATTTDQANKTLSSITDAFGRVVQMNEDPNNLNYSTLYTYDAADNLRKIVQGQQSRYFMYDSMLRLIRTKNPEHDVNEGFNLYDPITGNSQWSLAYSYDAQSNLISRTDARGVTTTYSYDAMNRNILVSYSDGTSIERHYDGAVNGLMRFWYDYKRAQNNTTIEHVAVDSYDVLGNPLTQRRHFYQNNAWSPAYTVQRTYNHAGLVLTQTYPSGRSVTYTYDAAGRPNDFRGNIGDGVQRTYATSITYDEANRLTRETFGTDTALYHKLHYNVRGQLYDVRLSSDPDEWSWDRGAVASYYSNSYAHGGSGADNNGNVLRTEHFVPGSDFFQITYGYDQLNRITSATERRNGSTYSFAQNYSYDRYGNRTNSQLALLGNTFDANLMLASNYGQFKLSDEIAELGELNLFRVSAFTGDARDPRNRWYAPASGIWWQQPGQNDKKKGQPTPTPTPSPTPTSPIEVDPAQPQICNECEPGGGNEPPVSVPGGPYTGQTGQNIQFNGSGSYDPDGYLISYNWNFGDGTTGTGATPVHAYASAATYTVTLTVKDNSNVLRSASTTATVSAPGATNGAAFVSQSVPTSMNAGQNYTVSVTMNNSGSSTWTTDLYKLGSQNPQDNGTWGTGRVYLSSAVAPGANYTFSFTVTAPSTPGTYNFQWRMVKEGVEWFGAYTTNIAVSVTSAGPSAQLEIDQATNRAYAPNDPTHTRMSYDAAGNLINDTYTGYGSRTYDAENRMASSYDIGNAVSRYSYDADGHRVRRVTGGLEWWHIYGMDGEVVAEYLAGAAPTAPQKEYGYRKEQLLIVASPSANVQWLVTDHLGTPRMVVDLTGSLAGVKRHDYLPFGEEILAGTGGRTMQQGYFADGVRQKFTGQERDTETGLDYFINRYYSSIMGRFTSPDPVSLTSHRKTDPQRLNLYTYARNNPVLLTDPNGLELYVTGTDAEVARFLSDLERITGLKFDYDKSTGRVTIAKNSPKPKNAEAVRIAGIIGDLSNRVEAYVMKGDNPKYTQRGVLIANTNSTGQTIIDYEDVDKNSATSKGTRPLNIIYHEIVEAYEYLTNKAAKAALAAGDKKKAYEIVHQAAIDAENVYRKRIGIPARGAMTTEGPVVDAKGDLIISATGDARYKIDYTTHIEYWTSNENSQSKISSIQVVKKP